ncbi:hypothetical protein L3476_25765 [Paenibacillus thiaminolyticus]|uniref:hypothetical protein n=1 Tax=Paenibacillus thiaminolyticus TaxID=49283 RepID=UPI0013F6035F|nr:hypothetical protein [Paenibacillus thiaminolyticus]NGP58359.1 hypothetical protein [Paenibacillus thiaminolyticus]WCR26589.1 hypothetical protein L3476_25765 [Paenibacillus thiaminolyticus]
MREQMGKKERGQNEGADGEEGTGDRMRVQMGRKNRGIEGESRGGRRNGNNREGVMKE